MSQDLAQLINAHPMPKDSGGISFEAQLKAKFNLSDQTVANVLREYKRFIYLVATSQGARRVPSKAVDEVWHLHMMHSRDYWDVFCAIIGRPLHHTPGGDDRLNASDHSLTNAAYEQAFGDLPPHDVWQSNLIGRKSINGFIGAGVLLFAIFGAIPSLSTYILAMTGAWVLAATFWPTIPQAAFEFVSAHEKPDHSWGGGSCSGADCGGGCGGD
ncbi:MAG: glycine-rich domain-containing protein [Planktomarina sp.]